jgi:hypothetical protein
MHVYPDTTTRHIRCLVSFPEIGVVNDAPEARTYAQRVVLTNSEFRIVVYVYVEALQTDVLKALARMVVEKDVDYHHMAVNHVYA